MNNYTILEQEVQRSPSISLNEKEYFTFHKKRFQRFDQFLEKITVTDAKNFKVLEIGSHYLHTSLLLAGRGFQIDAMDVGEFWNLDFVKSRGERFGLNPIIENDLSKMEMFKDIENEYDLVVFTEIMEHITFNPVQFWKTIYQILKPGGKIYVSTPNAFALPNYIRNLKNTLFLKSIGITIDEILAKVTYGHHWKEYSPNEIRAYFTQLSPDFEVTISPYHYKNYELKPPYFMFKLLSKLGNMTDTFADDLEVIVNLKQKSQWGIKEPEY